MTNDSQSNRTPAIIGFLIAGVAILGISFFVSSRPDDAYDAVPPIRIVAPASGDSVTNRVTIRFRTPGALRLDPAMGWMAGDLHLHAIVDGIEIMPAAADIIAADSAYSWELPPFDTGARTLYLTWAGRHHGNLRGETDTITVHIAR